MDGDRVRHDLALVVVPADERRSTLAGRLVALEDGRWRLVLPVDGAWTEARGDRWEGSRDAARLVLRAATGGG